MTIEEALDITFKELRDLPQITREDLDAAFQRYLQRVGVKPDGL